MIDGPTCTVHEALAAATDALAAASVPDARREARLLLAHALQEPLAYLLTHTEARLGRVTATLFRALLARRTRREPFAYLCGKRAWLDVDLMVDRNVLIPRPETELLAQAAVAEALRLRRSDAIGDTPPVVVDAGTGSGAIAIAVARGCADATIYATDTSTGALRVAARNLAQWAPGRVQLIQGDLLDGVDAPVNIIAANLPYIPTPDLATLEPELAFEPRSALDGGPDGLDAVRALLEQAPAHMASHGSTVLLECGHDQAGRIAAYATARWPAARIESRTDLAGIARFVHVYISGR